MYTADMLSEKLKKFLQNPPVHGLLSLVLYYRDGKPIRIITGHEDSTMLESVDVKMPTANRIQRIRKIPSGKIF
jgi:hypothetical protein